MKIVDFICIFVGLKNSTRSFIISMSAHFIYFVVIFILVADFGLERSLAYLNIKHSKLKLPDILSDIYDAENYARQQNYFRTNTRFGFVTATFGFIVILLIYIPGGFGWLDSELTTFIEADILRSLAFFAILFIANDLINIPFEWYDTFVIEERFGFNKVTPGLFVLDKLKSYLLAAIIGGGLLVLVIWIYNLTPQFFWLIAWAVMTIFGLFMSMFYSEIIVPLFNKQTPLPEGELRDKIETFAGSVHFKLTNIYVIDGSKRSTKANAYFTGFGPKKRIALYDTLLDKLTTDEIVAVLAHEVGHYKHKHTIKNILISLPSSLLLFFLLGIMLRSDALAQAFGGVSANFHLNILAFGIIYSPVSLALGLISNHLSRRYEYQADSFTATHGLGDVLISGLKKLSSSSLSNLTPHPLYVFFHYSHPTIYQRILNIKSSIKHEVTE